MDPFRREQRNIAGKYFILPNSSPALSAATKTNWNNVTQRVKIMDAAATVISGLTVERFASKNKLLVVYIRILMFTLVKL